MAKIYKLTCEDPELIYYGSTIQPLNRRLLDHRCKFNRGDGTSSKPLFEKGNVEIHLIEECSIEDRFKIEASYMENYPCVNKQRPYYQGNGRKERNRVIDNIYKEKNREILNKKKIEKITCECGLMVCRSAISSHRKTKKHLDFVNHGVKPSFKQPRYICECGSITGKYDLHKHKKSKKHQDYINKL